MRHRFFLILVTFALFTSGASANSGDCTIDLSPEEFFNSSYAKDVVAGEFTSEEIVKAGYPRVVSFVVEKNYKNPDGPAKVYIERVPLMIGQGAKYLLFLGKPSKRDGKKSFSWRGGACEAMFQQRITSLPTLEEVRSLALSRHRQWMAAVPRQELESRIKKITSSNYAPSKERLSLEKECRAETPARTDPCWLLSKMEIEAGRTGRVPQLIEHACDVHHDATACHFLGRYDDLVSYHEKNCEKGDTGSCYWAGEHHGRLEEAGRKWHRLSCDKGGNCSGLIAYHLKHKEMDEAIELTKPACAANSGFVCADIARWSISEGKLDEADSWLSEQCDRGVGRACRAAISIRHERGDREGALQMATLGCDAGDRKSCDAAGVLRLPLGLTLFGPTQREELQKWEKRTERCRKGDVRECIFLGKVYKRSGNIEKLTQIYEYGCKNTEKGDLCYEAYHLLERLGKHEEARALLVSSPRGASIRGKSIGQVLDEHDASVNFRRQRSKLEEECSDKNYKSCFQLGVKIESDKYIAIACDGGLKQACAKKKRDVELKEQSEKRIEQEKKRKEKLLGVWQKRCQLGYVQDCKGLARENLLEHRDVSRKLYERACLLGDADSCWRVSSSAESAGYPDESRDWVAVACQLGYRAVGCEKYLR